MKEGGESGGLILRPALGLQRCEVLPQPGDPCLVDHQIIPADAEAALCLHQACPWLVAVRDPDPEVIGETKEPGQMPAGIPEGRRDP